MPLFEEPAASREERLARLRGVLAAFEWINLKADHGYTFSLDRLERRASLEETLSASLPGLKSVTVSKLPNWRKEVVPILEMWLLAFRLDAPYVLIETPGHTHFASTNAAERRELAAELAGEFDAVIRPVSVWAVRIEVDGFCECEWDDFAFVADDAVYLLHLGWSD